MSRSFTEVPLTPLRKAIAARMTQANQTIPHFRLVATEV
ncbi:MAG: 2-oxo acid dehydrogenase subunit E2, partial [Mesorhizobium sp.]